MNFAKVEKIAAAILYEGYILYPYRPSAIKNRQRWNFGTLYPRAYAEARRPQEPYRFVAECLVEECTEETELDIRIQFLQLMQKRGEASGREASGSSDDRMHGPREPSLEWDEAVEWGSDVTGLRLEDRAGHPLMVDLQLRTFAPPEAAGVGETSAGIEACLGVGVERLSTGLLKVRLELQNQTQLANGARATREEALPHAFVSAHALLGVRNGRFVSLLDPPESYREAVAGCGNTGVFPVLAGDETERTMMFCSPIILYDYPKIAPESEGDFFDGTEMDEMLTLRVLTLTEAEKQEVREGDARARRILERTESLTAESMMKAHGAIRGMRDIRREDAR